MSTVLRSGRGGKGKKKTLKNKSREKKIRAEGSRPVGQVDFLLDFFLAERKSIFRVYCFTSPEAEVWKGWSAWIRHLQREMCLHSNICWPKAIQTPDLPILQGGSVGTTPDMAGNWSRRLFAFPSQNTHHRLLIYMTNALCYPLFAQWFRHSHLPFTIQTPCSWKKKKKRMMSEGKKLSSPGCLDPGHVFGWLCAC